MFSTRYIIFRVIKIQPNAHRLCQDPTVPDVKFPAVCHYPPPVPLCPLCLDVMSLSNPVKSSSYLSKCTVTSIDVNPHFT